MIAAPHLGICHLPVVAALTDNTFMGMKPDDFFVAFVQPSVGECYEDPSDVRRGFNAAVAVGHFADHYYEYCIRHAPEKVASFGSFPRFLAHLATLTDNAFNDVRSVSNAYKHLYTTRDKNRSHSTVSSSGSIESLHVDADFEITDVGPDYEPETPPESRWRVVFRRRDGTRGDLLLTLEKCVDVLSPLAYGLHSHASA